MIEMTAKELRIVTNNSWIETGPAVPHEIVFVEGTPMEVLDKTEELLQQGWRLVSAPLPPNVPIMRGPYRSLVIEKNDRQMLQRTLRDAMIIEAENRN